MGEELRNRGGACPKLLDLMAAKERDWMVGDDSNGGGFGVQEEKKLELKLGPPTDEDWRSNEKEILQQTSVPSLHYIPISKTNKRAFLDTAISINEGFQQQQTPSSSHAAASGNAAGPNNSNSSKARTTTVPVVGWPPVRSFRKNLVSSCSSKLPPSPSQNGDSKSATKTDICKKGLFVKINMDGIPIGRKVGLTADGSYEKLSSAVKELFQGLLAAQKDPADAGAKVTTKQRTAFTGLLDGTGEYTLVYEDNEGDRILVGDVPWEMFISTCKRLRVLKTSELSTLALGASSSRKRTAIEC